MHAANDNAGIDWTAPVKPCLQDIFDTIILYKANDAANDNIMSSLPRSELFRLLGEGLAPL